MTPEPRTNPQRDTSAPTSSTLVENASRVLRADVQSGLLPPGSRIHLADTARRLGISPIPVREALRILATEGVVLSLPQRGYRVPEPTLDDLRDTYDLRLILDPLAVARAVPQLVEDPDALDALAATVPAFDDALHRSDLPEVRRLNRAFHFGIYEQARSPRLLRLISFLWEASESYQRIGASHSSRESRSGEHVQILEACRAGDAELAAERMREHLHHTYTLASAALGDGG